MKAHHFIQFNLLFPQLMLIPYLMASIYTMKEDSLNKD
jgi:ABC-type antimicrobial peptide transport system permease subunit